MILLMQGAINSLTNSFTNETRNQALMTVTLKYGEILSSRGLVRISALVCVCVFKLWLVCIVVHVFIVALIQ